MVKFVKIYSEKMLQMRRWARLLSWSVLVVGGIVVFLRCENPLTGYGPQPSFIEENRHEPMLNVFGILRPGMQGGAPLSFVHLESTFSVTSAYPDSFDVKDATVTLLHYEGEAVVDSLSLLYTDFNATFSKYEYRPDNFTPIERHTYGISCWKPGYPELTSKTTVPSVPMIVENSLKIEANKVSFEIVRDSLAGLYDLFLVLEQTEYTARIIRPEIGNIKVEMAFNKGAAVAGILILYAYDVKLTEYITFNVTLKPNTYHRSYSTVTNGYGCFGSMNIGLQKIRF